jgi:hypothetical protein
MTLDYSRKLDLNIFLSLSERLCGSVMCADCSRFIEWDFCRKLINPSNISVYRYVNIYRVTHAGQFVLLFSKTFPFPLAST